MSIERTAEDIARFNASMKRIDAKLIAAVKAKLGTDEIQLIEYRQTGLGCQTVPVFAVPASVKALAIELGLTVQA
jgi:hypothetical protein